MIDPLACHACMGPAAGEHESHMGPRGGGFYGDGTQGWWALSLKGTDRHQHEDGHEGGAKVVEMVVGQLLQVRIRTDATRARHVRETLGRVIHAAEDLHA